MRNITLIISLILFSNVITYWYSATIKSFFPWDQELIISDIKSFFIKDQKLIISEVQLETNCELMNEAFVVADLVSKKSVSFGSSKAYIQTFEDNLLQIQINPKFSDVTADFRSHPAKKKMKIKIDCDTSNGLKNTLDSLRNTFKN